MKVKVYIATTEGPALVQRVTEEDSEIPSVVCLNGTTETLAISDAYGRFVRKGSGIVAGLTGHDSYRVDVDSPIDGGQSWQLGMLLAHLLQQENRLAAPNEAAELTLFATGEVDRDLNLRSVGHIAEKADGAQTRLNQTDTDADQSLFVMPKADDIQHAQPFVGKTVSLATVPEAAELLNLSSLKPTGTSLRAEGRVTDVTPKRNGAGVLVTALAGASLLAAGTVAALPETRGHILDWASGFLFSRPDVVDPIVTDPVEDEETTIDGGDRGTAGEDTGQSQSTEAEPAPTEEMVDTSVSEVDPLPPVEGDNEATPTEQDPEPTVVSLSLIVQEERAPAGFTCKSLRFAQLDTIAGAVTPEPDGSFLSNGGRGVCEIAYRVINQGSVAQTVTIAATIGTKTLQETGVVDPSGFLVVPLDFSRIESGVLAIVVSVTEGGTSRSIVETRHLVRP